MSEGALAEVDARVHREVDAATDLAEASPPPAALDALVGIYASPPSEQPLWFRAEGAALTEHERSEGWGTWNAGDGEKHQ